MQPPEPLIGTVLETRDSIEAYRIERTAAGWHLQYRDGENENGRALTATPISWRAAWMAWGPPAGAQPFTPVRPGAAPLPPAPPDESEPWEHGPDATGQRLTAVPAAGPYRPPITSGAVMPGPCTRNPDCLREDGHSGICSKSLAGHLIGTLRGKTTIPSSPTSASGTSGGTVTASIETVKVQIMAAIDVAQQGLGTLQHGSGQVEQAQAMLQLATEGSGQVDASQACAQLAQAGAGITDQQHAVQAAIQSAEDVLARL